MKKRWVLLRRIKGYEPARLRAVVDEGFELMEVKPHGKVLIKPNIVFANKQYSNYAYTNPELVGTVVDKLRDSGVNDVCIGESGGFAIPTRMFFKESGYSKMARERSVPLIDFNEEPAVAMKLERALMHMTYACPKRMQEAEFKIWMPKLKYHICCQITQALKLNIGSLLHSERMHCHDDRLNDKIVDMLEPCYPDMVISDAVIIGHGFESCAKPFPLGVVLVSNDPVAADVVAAHIMGYEPAEVIHLRKACERGYGSLDLDSIELLGDVTIEELRERTKDVVSEFQDIQKLDTPIRFYEGIGPNTGEVCYGGCMAAVKGAFGTIDASHPGALRKAKPGAIVTGIYEGDVDAGDGVCVLLGDCTSVTGKITARKIKRIGGCPIGAVKTASLLPLYFGLPHPFLNLRDDFNMVTNTVLKLFYQIKNRAL